jgi:hypothetical protein
VQAVSKHPSQHLWCHHHQQQQQEQQQQEEGEQQQEQLLRYTITRGTPSRQQGQEEVEVGQ